MCGFLVDSWCLLAMKNYVEHVEKKLSQQAISIV